MGQEAMVMIDLHCHILSGVDDGARSLSDSVEMAKQAVQQGIVTIVATPHHMNGKYENRRQAIAGKVKELQQKLAAEQIPLTILPGQEVRIHGEMVEAFELGEIQPLADSSYVLVEFPFTSVPSYTEQLLFDLQMKGLTPVIAHPERNQQIIEQPDLLYKLINNGALSQVTAASIIGGFGKKVKNFTFQLIEANLTHFIASDAHNIRNRSFKMAEAFDLISSKYDDDIVYLMKENAALVVEGKNVYKEIPEQVKRKKLFKLF